MQPTVSMADDCNRVEVVICSPHQPIRVVSAKTSGRIAALQTLWPDIPKRFIYDGMELIEGKTFEFYRIQNGDSILAISKSENDQTFDWWKKISNEQTELNDLVRAMTNHSMSGEMSRIRDLRMMQIESKSTFYHKFRHALENAPTPLNSFSCFSDNSSDVGKELSLNQITFPSPLLAPSEEELPILW